MASTPAKKVISAVTYGVSSILLVMANKRILYTYKFGSPVVLLTLHLICSLFLLEAWNQIGLLGLRPFKWKVALKMMPLCVMFVLNILISFFALSRTSIPMFTTLRRMTAIFVLIGQWQVLGMTPSRTVIKCVFLMMFGAVIAGLSDLAYDPFGYFCVFLNNSLTAGYLVSMKFYFGSLKLKAVEVLRYNCVASIPLMLMICYANGEVNKVLRSPTTADTTFMALFLCSGFLAFSVNCSTYWCTQVNSPLTTSITGQLKNVLTTVMGMFLFPDVHITPTFLIGIGVGTVGGILYSVHKFMESQKPKPDKPQTPDDVDQEQGDGTPNGTTAANPPVRMSMTPRAPRTQPSTTLTRINSEGRLTGRRAEQLE